MWSVVAFQDNSVEVVPSKWFDNGVCAWPKRNLKSFIDNQVSPCGKEFRYLSNARKLGKDRREYNTAQEKANLAKLTSDLLTNDSSQESYHRNKPRLKRKVCQEEQNSKNHNLWSPASSDMFDDSDTDPHYTLPGLNNINQAGTSPLPETNSKIMPYSCPNNDLNPRKKLDFGICPSVGPSTSNKIKKFKNTKHDTSKSDNTTVVISTPSSPFKVTHVENIASNTSQSSQNKPTYMLNDNRGISLPLPMKSSTRPQNTSYSCPNNFSPRKKIGFDKYVSISPRTSNKIEIFKNTNEEFQTLQLNNTPIIISTPSSPFKVTHVENIVSHDTCQTVPKPVQLSQNKPKYMSNDNRDMLEKVNRNVLNMKYEIKSMHEKIDKIEELIVNIMSNNEHNRVVGSVVVEDSFQNTINNELPLEDEEALQSFENKLLENSGFRAQMVTELSRYVRITLPSTVRAMMRRLFKDSLLQNYSYKGQRGKKVFSTLVVCSIVFGNIYILLHTVVELRGMQGVHLSLGPSLLFLHTALLIIYNYAKYYIIFEIPPSSWMTYLNSLLTSQ